MDCGPRITDPGAMVFGGRFHLGEGATVAGCGARLSASGGEVSCIEGLLGCVRSADFRGGFKKRT